MFLVCFGHVLIRDKRKEQCISNWIKRLCDNIYAVHLQGVKLLLFTKKIY